MADVSSEHRQQQRDSPKTRKHEAGHRRRHVKFSQRRKEVDAVKKKYSLTQIDKETYQVFIPPSDPDFAFDLTLLDVDLCVPQHYPHHGSVTLKVNNSEIPRGHALNVENYFGTLNGPLLDRLALLDQKLEELLKLPPQKTITLIRSKTSVKPKSEPPKEAVKLRELPREIKTDFNNREPILNQTEQVETEPEEAAAHRSHAENDVQGPKHSGTELVFPEFYMTGMDVVEIASLSILIRCGRCKDLQEFANLQSAEYGHQTKATVKACEKCKLTLAAAFRKEFLTTESNTGGFIDISGGSAVDLLPSSYIGVCGNCSELLPTFRNMDLGTVREQFCRHCHAKASLRIELFRFDVLSTESLGRVAKGASNPDQQVKPKLTGGETLPEEGRCKHYRKSFRWFRFSCCKRVFPCDRCHDAQMGHSREPASRMICGKCSREQMFADQCRFCGHSYVTRNTAFWEGGRGVRNQALMSRKDKRKYKRRAQPA